MMYVFFRRLAIDLLLTRHANDISQINLRLTKDMVTHALNDFSLVQAASLWLFVHFICKRIKFFSDQLGFVDFDISFLESLVIKWSVDDK